MTADWDDDGRRDLLLGCGDGSVWWFRNVTDSREPTLEAGRILIPPPAPTDTRGSRAKACPVDWNGDGRLDLIVGDQGKDFDNELTDEEVQYRADTRRHQQEFLKLWAQVFAEYRKLLAEQSAGGTEAKETELAARRAEMVRLNAVRARHNAEEQAIQTGKQFHGRVWVYLRAESKPKQHNRTGS